MHVCVFVCVRTCMCVCDFTEVGVEGSDLKWSPYVVFIKQYTFVTYIYTLKEVGGSLI